MKNFFRLSAIVGSLPVTLQNGTTADATQVMSDLNWIVNQVNANAAPLVGTALTNANNNFTVVQSGIAASSPANFPIASQVQNNVFNTLSSTLGTNTLTARSATLQLSAYASGQIFTFIPSQPNSGASSINIDGLGAKTILVLGSNLAGGELSPIVPSQVEYDGTAFNLLGGNSRPVVGRPPVGSGRNILCRTNAVSPNTQIDFAADEFVVEDGNGNALNLKNVSGTINLAVNGANGLDTGAQTAQRHYPCYVIAQPSGSFAGLASLSSTAPSLPSGYSFKGLITSGRTDGANNLLPFRHIGNTLNYVSRQSAVFANTGVSTLEVLVGLGSFVPSNAQGAILHIYGQATAGAGSISANAQFRFISGSTFEQSLLAAVAASASTWGYRTEIPNVTQQAFVLFDNTTNFANSNYNVDVLGFKLPMGGE